MQQVQEVTTDRGVIGLNIDHAAVVTEVIPEQQHAAKACHETVGDVARTGAVVVLLLGQCAAQGRYRRAHDIHGVR